MSKNRKWKRFGKKKEKRKRGGYISPPKLATAGLLAATAPVTIPLAMFAGPHIYQGYKARKPILKINIKI